ncbi:MAG: prepilin-type N-terminal cleavage/methylation domain-containing protein, partial [Coriobacteriales bacterium]|nr:prepilin-type N-terminal cleavage/methylation domain-containing protein [Coriobacteriales bacterium]
MRTQRAVAAWAPRTEAPHTGNAGSNTLRPRRLSSSTSPVSPQPGSSVCGTHRTFPVQGAIQRRGGFTLVELIVSLLILALVLGGITATFIAAANISK